MIAVENDRAARTIRITMAGFVKLDEVLEAAARVRRETDSYRGAPHLVLADMRGLKPLPPEVADAITAAIAYTRARGVVHCAHVAESSTVQLQASRMVKEVVAGDPGMTTVTSLEEAEKVLAEHRARLAPAR